MFSCKDVSEKASDHLDGNLSFMERMNMRLHLLICHHCRQFLKQFKATIKLTKKVQLPAESEEIDAQTKRLMEIRKKQQ